MIVYGRDVVNGQRRWPVEAAAINSLHNDRAFKNVGCEVALFSDDSSHGKVKFIPSGFKPKSTILSVLNCGTALPERATQTSRSANFHQTIWTSCWEERHPGADFDQDNFCPSTTYKQHIH
ncbi:hypothetical protein T07_9457 [Trichinella nelsoni]|uniref:Uncharacterized protein n=1 Tax=Trichinella nelsoni TaxID=6336 RepID=A0A0V0RPP6_9BILA|nr:hypothetical protein T07_9457 [Trichinella nelsoni]